MQKIDISQTEARALIAAIMAYYGSLQDITNDARLYDRDLELELAEFRLGVCDKVIDKILAAHNVDGWIDIEVAQ